MKNQERSDVHIVPKKKCIYISLYVHTELSLSLYIYISRSASTWEWRRGDLLVAADGPGRASNAAKESGQ